MSVLKTLTTEKPMLKLLLAALALAGSSIAALAAGRVLHVDDVLQIKVVSQPDLDTSARVETDGTINFPYAGRIRAVGRTQDDLAQTIAQKLKQGDVVKDPHVLVEIATFGSQATVQGSVNTPGAFPLDRETTLTQVLSRAGGLKEASGDVIVRRHGKGGQQVMRYPARALVTGKLDGSKIAIYNNDEIYVDEAPFYYLYGFVNRTGQYPLVRTMTVQQALATGGGVGPLGSDWRIRIKRRQEDGTMMEIPASLDDVVQPNDTIVVNERIF